MPEESGADRDTLLHENPKFRVKTRALVGRDGVTRQKVLLEHPGAVVILPITQQGELVLIRNYRFPVGRSLLEVPAGTLGWGEDPLEAAKRELAEETGYTAASWSPLLRYYSAPAFCTEEMWLYEARDLKPGEMALDPDEDIVVEHIPVSEVDALLDNGHVEDAKTYLTLLWWLRTRGESP